MKYNHSKVNNCVCCDVRKGRGRRLLRLIAWMSERNRAYKTGERYQFRYCERCQNPISIRLCKNCLNPGGRHRHIDTVPARFILDGILSGRWGPDSSTINELKFTYREHGGPVGIPKEYTAKNWQPDRNRPALWFFSGVLDGRRWPERSSANGYITGGWRF